MRWVLALLLAATALAGCTAGNGNNDTGPNADPLGQKSYPPLVNSSTPPPSTATGPSVQPSNSTSSSSASGTTTAAGSARFGPHDQEDSDSDADFPGLLLGGHLSGGGAQVEVQASANNVGERTYQVPSGCGDGWTETMTGSNGELAIRKPASACTSTTYHDLAAHDYLSKDFSWDGTVWDDSSQSFVPAAKGTYTWHVAFDVYSGSTHSDHTTLTMDFLVSID